MAKKTMFGEHVADLNANYEILFPTCGVYKKGDIVKGVYLSADTHGLDYLLNKAGAVEPSDAEECIHNTAFEQKQAVEEAVRKATDDLKIQLDVHEETIKQRDDEIKDLKDKLAKATKKSDDKGSDGK